MMIKSINNYCMLQNSNDDIVIVHLCHTVYHDIYVQQYVEVYVCRNILWCAYAARGHEDSRVVRQLTPVKEG